MDGRTESGQALQGGRLRTNQISAASPRSAGSDSGGPRQRHAVDDDALSGRGSLEPFPRQDLPRRFAVLEGCITSLARLGVFIKCAERRYAREASEQLLKLFWGERRERPELKARALYEAVIARRLGANLTISAADIVRRAEQSFAAWPIRREVRFRDVVHYQIFDEYMRQGETRVGTRTNFGEAVARIIPTEL